MVHKRSIDFDFMCKIKRIYTIPHISRMRNTLEMWVNKNKNERMLAESECFFFVR